MIKDFSFAAPVLHVFISVFLTLPPRNTLTHRNIYPSTQPVLSLPSQAQVFLNQLYKTPVEHRLDKNPDLRSIRFASFNPILDPWIYILLRKAVLLKLIEKVKCLFCKIGARRQQRQGTFHCTELSSVISNRDSHSLVSHDLRDVTSNSQTFLYLPEGNEVYTGSCHKANRLSGSRPSSVRNSQASHSSEQGSVEAQSREGTNVTRDLSALPCPKDSALQVSLSTEPVEEKCIWLHSELGESSQLALRSTVYWMTSPEVNF